MTLVEALEEIDRLDEQMRSLIKVLNNRFNTEGQEITDTEYNYLSDFDIHAINRAKYPWCNQCQGIQTA
jgi:hypothetical protein